ncbi:phage head morphogenesis protein [Clostridium sp.]|uniref:phage head morphogenesis protein n=1 Tax=Clostridium sp. TaxID=1506 RepID=UPI00321735AE
MSKDKEEFIQDLYDQAEEELKDVYKKKKEDRDKLLQQIAMIMLAYTILNGFMSMTKNEKDKESSKISNDIKKYAKGQIEIQTSVIGKILKSTVEQTYDRYSYNYKLKDVRNIIDKNFEGKHFSKTVWKNEQKTANDLNKLLNQFLDGKIGVNKIEEVIKNKYGSSSYEAKRLTETELNRCEAEAFKSYCRFVGVKKVIRNEILDSKTCEICAGVHGKVYDLEKAPDSIHPCCRGFNDMILD